MRDEAVTAQEPSQERKRPPARRAQCRDNTDPFFRQNPDARRCELCSNPLPERPSGSAGRPRTFCTGGCRRINYALWRLVFALEVEPRGSVQGIRSKIVAEVLNRLPLDSSALSDRAARQPRDDGGRFA